MCVMSAGFMIISTFMCINLFHAIAALLWIAGLRRFMRPFSPLILFDLFRWALIIPPVLILLRLFNRGSEGPHLIRAELWARQFFLSKPLLTWLVLGLLIGTLLIFIFQELIPFIQIMGRKQIPSHAPSARLKAALVRAKAFYREAGILSPRISHLRTHSFPAQERLAALHGLGAPVLVVSDGLVEALDDEELEGVLSHELAHIYLGGNMRMVWIWIARGLQAFNPVSLVLFRELTEAREAACDALAAKLTGKPEVLARALLKFTEDLEATSVTSDDPRTRAGIELRRRAEIHSTQTRYEALTGELTYVRITIWSAPLQWLTALVLGGMLWIVA